MIADMCDHLCGADAEIVTRAVGADSRIGRKYLKPAIGYGGPCFPRDNKAFAALGRKLGVNCDLAEATDRINEHQLNRLFGAVQACSEPGGIVAVLGLSYKPDTHVVEESQGVALARLLFDDYQVRVFDPAANAAAASLFGERARICESAEDAIREADVVVIATPWPEFNNLDWAADPGRIRSVIDPWGVARRPASDLGTRIIRLGRGDWRGADLGREAAA